MMDEEYFWNHTFDEISDVCFGSIRDKLRNDLSSATDSVITFKTIADIVNQCGLPSYYIPSEGDDPKTIFMNLVEIWVIIVTKGDMFDKIYKSTSFSHLLAGICLGYHAGYFDDMHEKACEYYKEIKSSFFDLKSPEGTINLFNKMLDFYGLCV